MGAELLYQEASGLDPDDLPAFEGLANLQIATHKVEEGAQTYSHLVRLLFLTITLNISRLLPAQQQKYCLHGLACKVFQGYLACHRLIRADWCSLQVKLARTKSAVEKQREFLWRCAEAEDRLNKLSNAQDHLQTLLAMPLDSDEQRLEALCFLADVQVSLIQRVQALLCPHYCHDLSSDPEQTLFCDCQLELGYLQLFSHALRKITNFLSSLYPRVLIHDCFSYRPSWRLSCSSHVQRRWLNSSIAHSRALDARPPSLGWR